MLIWILSIVKFFNKMKKLFLLLLLIGFIWIAPQRLSAQVAVSFQIFYDDLSPYGTWVDNPNYGYVWMPNVDAGFSPYRTNGHWVYTEVGWTWFSDYPWGWAPFHYGRWYSDPVYGPMWVPGNEWGPGWVTWRRNEGYYGWAPIEPGISISVAYSSGYYASNDHWVFVRERDFGRSNMNNYYVNSSNNVTIIHNSTVINNIHNDHGSNVQYNEGPGRKDIEKLTGRPVNQVQLKESNKPGQSLNNNQLQMYRPRVEKNNSGQKAAPTKVVHESDLKPASERKNTLQPQNENQQNKSRQMQKEHIEKPSKSNPEQYQQKNKPVKQSEQLQNKKQPENENPQKNQQQEQPVNKKTEQNQDNNQPHNNSPSQKQKNEQIKENHSKPPQINQMDKKQSTSPVKQQPKETIQNKNSGNTHPPKSKQEDHNSNQQPQDKQEKK